MTFREEDSIAAGRMDYNEFAEDVKDLDAFRADVNEMLGLLPHLKPEVVARLRMQLLLAFVDAAAQDPLRHYRKGFQQ